VGGVAGLNGALRDPVAIGVLIGLVVGKPIGVFGATWLVARFTRAELDGHLSWWDMLGLAMLAGVGFTVSLLIGEPAFGTGSDRDNHVKVAVLAGTITAATLAAMLLRARSNVYERIFAAEAADSDNDGTPDAYETDR
jgi:NhaA family Na+:H+ antiporter